MKQFVERLKTDKDFAAEFKDYMLKKNDKVKEGTKLVGEQLNKLVMGSIKDFAAEKGMELKDDEQTSKSLAGLSKQICMQMDDMIVKSFASLEGSMKNPINMPPEIMKLIVENKDTYIECCKKIDKKVEEAVQTCMRAWDAAVVEALTEFTKKVGYDGPVPSSPEMNKEVAKKLNEVVDTQFKGLMQANVQ